MKTSVIIKSLIKGLAIIIVVSYVVFAIFKVASPAKEQVCTGLEVEFMDDVENALIDARGVENILATHKVSAKGLTFVDIDTDLIDSLLMDNPYIDTVYCYQNSADGLSIRVTPTEPILHCMPASGKDFYIDRGGDILPGGGLNTNLCIVTGHVTQQFAKENLLTLAYILCDDPYWRLQAEQIYVTKDHDLHLFMRTGDQTIVLGPPTDVADKLERVRLFYEKAMGEVGWNTYKTIDAQYKGQLVCTKNKL